MRKQRLTVFPISFLLIAALVLGIPFKSVAESYGTSEVASIANDSSLPNGPTEKSIVSADGRYVYFSSHASNLVSNDTNNAIDIFVRDRLTGTTTRLDVSSSNDQANEGANDDFDISDGGRYLVFSSTSTNLVSSEYNQNEAIFIRDLKTGETSLLYQNHYSGQGAGDVAISGNGDWVTFGTQEHFAPYSDLANNVYLINRKTLSLTRISNELGSDGTGYDGAGTSKIDYDGSKIVFQSTDPNLVSNDTNGRLPDDFLWDKETDSITMVDVSSSGDQANKGVGYYNLGISGDGNKIVFSSTSTNLVSPATTEDNVYLHQVDTGSTTLISSGANGEEGNGPSGTSVGLSEDGNYIVFESYATNLVPDYSFDKQSMFVKDVDNNSITLVGLDADGNPVQTQSFPDISADGQYVTFAAILPSSGQRVVYLRY